MAMPGGLCEVGCMGCTGLYRQVCSDLTTIEHVKRIIDGPKENKKLRTRKDSGDDADGVNGP
jgi:hypothetical protein